ncbi:GNAT family N-acetyltransferase [Massilia sp. TWP1-3-3]|uniref:GNAT family N-acetyltransferase n=1 Tax=Massilia sp. TWP1-3-3 TaxID=2804573 RepID=UPI003CF52DEE
MAARLPSSNFHTKAPMHGTLANPMWSSLTTSHAGFAHACGPLLRFAPDVAPFCAVEHAGADLGALDCMHRGEIVYFLGVAPALAAGWKLESAFQVLQMVYDARRAPGAPCQTPAVALGEADIGAMLDLTALAYPEFFRPRTAALGHYIGVHTPHGLAAMAGQRLASTGYREISAVVTHPAHGGMGHAAHLIRQLSGMILAEGRTPYLHVSASNKRAWALYENLGFVPTRELHSVKIRIA